MSAERELNAIEETAAGWMIERDHGMSKERERELEKWLRADPRHRTVFNALAETWSLIGEAQPVGFNASVQPKAQARRRLSWFPLTLAAAAALALAWVEGTRSASSQMGDSAERFAVTASTEVGLLRKVDLPDGSVIQLNTDSAVDVSYTPGERRVKLVRGEAHFTVAKSQSRPFIVSCAGVDVRVMGTVFNVRLRSAAVDVLVTEGKVRVDSAAMVSQPPAVSAPMALDGVRSELTAGQKLSVDLLREVPQVTVAATVSPAEIKQTLAWKARRLEFDATPLVEIVAEINRYNRHQLVIADSRLDAQRFGGSFPAGDHETFVRMLETNFGIVAERRESETRLRSK